MDTSNGNEVAPVVEPEPEPEPEVADVAAVMEKKVWGKFGKNMWPAEVTPTAAAAPTDLPVSSKHGFAREPAPPLPTPTKLYP